MTEKRGIQRKTQLQPGKLYRQQKRKTDQMRSPMRQIPGSKKPGKVMKRTN